MKYFAPTGPFKWTGRVKYGYFCRYPAKLMDL